MGYKINMQNPPSQMGFPTNLAPSYGVPGVPVALPQSANEVTLYVGNLSPVTDDARLIEFLKQSNNTSQFSTVRVMKDLYTSESRRFGFISYTSVEMAEKAKSELNYTKLDNFEIRICFKKNNSEFNPDANIFVGDVTKSTSTKLVDELFSQCGKLVSCSIRTNDKGESLGYGYVQFETEENATAAIKKFNKTSHFGGELKVEKFVPYKNRAAQKNNVYIKNFPKSWNKEQADKYAKEIAEKIGKIISVGATEKKLSNGNTSTAYFVAFESEDHALKLVKELNGKRLPDHAEDEEAIYSAFCEPKGKRASKLKNEMASAVNNTNLYIKSLLDTVTEEKIKEVFGVYGKITSIYLKESHPHFIPNGQAIKFACINFEKEAEAQNVLMNAKKDPAVKALIHPVHKKTAEFITFFQTRAVRSEYKRMRTRLQQSIHFSSIPVPPFFNQFPSQNFKKGPHQYNPLHMPQAMMGFYAPNVQGMPGKFPIMGRDMNMNSNTPQTNKNSQSSSTSRPGEEEVFTVETLKARKEEFLKFDKEKQQNILGNIMYHKVIESNLANKTYAPKITGMLIDLDILELNEIIDIMENKEVMNERINEALEVIEGNENNDEAEK